MYEEVKAKVHALSVAYDDDETEIVAFGIQDLYNMFNKSKKDNTVAKANLVMFFRQFSNEDAENLQAEQKSELEMVQKLSEMIIETCTEEGDEMKPAEGGISMAEFSKLVLKLLDAQYDQ